MTTDTPTRQIASVILPGLIFTALFIVMLASTGKIILFGGTDFSRIVAVSSYVILVLIGWGSFRTEKKKNNDSVRFSNLIGVLFSFLFPVVMLIMLFSLAKNMLSIFLIFRRAEREVYRQPAIPKRSRIVKKYRLGNLQIGDRVRFNPPDHDPVEGVVARFNKKTVKVINGSGKYWNVPHESLTKLRPATKTQQGKPSLQLIKG